MKGFSFTFLLLALHGFVCLGSQTDSPSRNKSTLYIAWPGKEENKSESNENFEMAACIGFTCYVGHISTQKQMYKFRAEKPLWTGQSNIFESPVQNEGCLRQKKDSNAYVHSVTTHSHASNEISDENVIRSDNFCGKNKRLEKDFYINAGPGLIFPLSFIVSSDCTCKDKTSARIPTYINGLKYFRNSLSFCFVEQDGKFLFAVFWKYLFGKFYNQDAKIVRGSSTGRPFEIKGEGIQFIANSNTLVNKDEVTLITFDQQTAVSVSASKISEKEIVILKDVKIGEIAHDLVMLNYEGQFKKRDRTWDFFNANFMFAIQNNGSRVFFSRKTLKSAQIEVASFAESYILKSGEILVPSQNNFKVRCPEGNEFFVSNVAKNTVFSHHKANFVDMNEVAFAYCTENNDIVVLIQGYYRKYNADYLISETIEKDTEISCEF